MGSQNPMKQHLSRCSTTDSNFTWHFRITENNHSLDTSLHYNFMVLNMMLLLKMVHFILAKDNSCLLFLPFCVNKENSDTF